MGQFQISEPKVIPYYGEESRRTLKEKWRKVKNTLYFLMAYACPNNTLRCFFHRRRGVHIGKNVYIGMFVYLDNLYPEYIYIEDGASINAQCLVLTHFNPRRQLAPFFSSMARPVVICKEAVVTVRCTIMPGVTIGENAVVSACSVVEKDVPAYTFAKGSPAKNMADFTVYFKKKTQ